MEEFDEATIDVIAAEIAQAMSHPVRLRILELLRENGAYVMDLVEWTGRPQANISQHLAILRDAGLVVAEREGMAVRYWIKDEKIFEVIEKLKAMAKKMVVSGEVQTKMDSPKFQRMLKKCRGGKKPWGKKWRRW